MDGGVTTAVWISSRAHDDLNDAHTHKPMKLRLLQILAIAALTLSLAACASPSPTPAPVAATVPPTATRMPPTATQASTATPVPTASQVPPTATPAPTDTLVPPTPAPTLVVLLAPSGAPAEALFQNIKGAVQDLGWQANWKPDPTLPDLRAVAQAGAAVVVVTDRALEAEAPAVAGEFPKTYFICLHLSETGAAPNLLALGGATREDQAGFMAGAMAGYVTEAKRVAVIGDPQSATGRKYRNGFLHGVRYTCPKCQVDNLDVLNLDDTTNVVDLAHKYKLYGVDVFFAAAGDAGNAALVKVAQAGAWVIGSGGDIYQTQFAEGSTAGADHVLTSVYLNPSLAVLNALTQYQAGTPLAGVQPLSAASQAVVLAPYREQTGVLTQLDQQDITTILTRLSQGALETGIDPVSGEER
jgi:basic membrane protein A and related proteins